MQKLIEHNLRLVVYIARKFENTNVGIEELISIGSSGLIKAINTFKPDKNIKLATYASRCIENEILMYLRKNQNIKDVYKRQIKEFDIVADTPEGEKVIYSETNNYQRLVRCPVKARAKSVKLVPKKTWGDEKFRVFSMDVL